MLKRILLFLVISITFFSCEKDDDNNNDNNSDNYNRSEMLIHWADNIIIPAYDAFYDKLITLDSSVDAFINNSNLSNHENLSNSWLECYKYWQHVEMFNIGKAEILYYKEKMNIYPTDQFLIESNIENGNYDIDNNANFDARGFPAIDYMLHGLADNNEDIIEIYNSNSNYYIYLKDLVTSMLGFTTLVIDDWNTYRDEFISSTNNTSTSSINKMTNDFIFYFEKGFRANKIGIPAGVFSAGTTYPEKVEAFYKKNVSKELALEALNACKNFFIGRSFSTQNINNSLLVSENIGLGLGSYLDSLAMSSENNLSNEIFTEFNNAETELNLLNDNFIDQINNNKLQMLYAYDVVQQLVVSFKVDMLASLAISVDYVDADGD
ncbi:MAG: peptidase M75 superfamily protein [Flavobacteriales bacterium]|nr:peptidase M75 superfamily protein [Flavobacteriales bacterium]|tara:strand:- start:993 stop:2129 length:1137 start_codon:yes stop_codon:yes gene_type:complete